MAAKIPMLGSIISSPKDLYVVTSVPPQTVYDQIKSSITGSCVSFSFDSGISGCTCTSSDAYKCKNGTFYPGVTCGGSVYAKKGACCLFDKENNTKLPCQPTTFCGCYELAVSFNFTFVWTEFTKDIVSCKYFECDDHVTDMGACCDGHGKCHETTSTECIALNHFFQGVGTKCIVDGNNICATGTGGCCEPGITCNNGVTAADCLALNKIYLGSSKLCYEFDIVPAALPCSSARPGYKLSVGDIVEDSMVVGIYTPGTTCNGNPIFGGNSTFNSLVNGEISTASSYLSKYDYNGYGNINNDVCDTKDSYIILISLHPLSYNNINNFTWNRGGMSYGPLISRSGKIIESHTEEINKKKEGYIFNSQLSNKINEQIIVYNSNLTTCFDKRDESDTVSERSFRNTEQNFNGRWSSDWGLHNTIRMINAELMYEAGFTYDSYLYSGLYSSSSDFKTNMTTSISALRWLNKTTKTTSNNISSWYIPSINELSFLAEQCKNNNLNTTLLNNKGSPIFGEQWSSTGAFNYTGSTGSEGIFNGSTADNGTYAWSMNFDNTDYTIKKDYRLTDKQVRPIRIIRCDGTNMEKSKDRLWWKVNY